jgi:hypothetical protein
VTSIEYLNILKKNPMDKAIVKEMKTREKKDNRTKKNQNWGL